jgi:hypothetical protein
MNCPEISSQVSGKPDKTDRTDTRARIRNPDIVRPDFPSGFALSVSGLCADEILSMAERLLETRALTHWQRAFVVGCRRHVEADRGLSEKQVAVLRKLIDIASDGEARAALNLAPARAFAQGA